MGHKCKINENYFENIDSHKKAYWLGFICADGHINKQGYLTIAIKDKEILEKFTKDTNSTYKIQHVFQLDNRTGKSYEKYSCCFSNKVFVSHIINHGVTHDKSDVLNFPNIDEQYYSSFIAGLFDGDGSVYVKDNGVTKVLGCNLISTKEVLNHVNNWLLEKYNIPNISCTRITKNKSNVWKQYWYKYAVPFLNIIYSVDPEMYLQRKYNLYLQNKDAKPTRNRIQRVHQYDENGNYIKTFSSLKEAADTYGSTNAPLCGCIDKRCKFKGYYWIRDNDDKIQQKIDIKTWKMEIKKQK